jgi:tetratricopeptide (TPR) repeat protein
LHADEVRARIAAEHEAARLRREANPEPEPISARFGSRCPFCMEEWDMNETHVYISCCCSKACETCFKKFRNKSCPLCRSPPTLSTAQYVAQIRRHVEKEVPDAICALGDCYRKGDCDGLVKSDKKAAKLYKRAAELGCLDAYLHLGILYEEGAGVKLDKKKTKQLYRIAADRGHAMAQFNLGQMLREEGSLEEAVVYYTRSAQQGYTLAEYNLGHAYGRGQGAEFDLDAAVHWMKRAAAKGHESAIALLRDLPSVR